MTIESGKLTELITFLNKDLSTVKTVHASVLPITAREQIRNGAEMVLDSYTVKMRYATDISPSLLVSWRSCIYEILQLNANKQQNEIYLTIQFSHRNQDNFKTT